MGWNGQCNELAGAGCLAACLSVAHLVVMPFILLFPLVAAIILGQSYQLRQRPHSPRHNILRNAIQLARNV